jgi:hypothetical protein
LVPNWIIHHQKVLPDANKRSLSYRTTPLLIDTGNFRGRFLLTSLCEVGIYFQTSFQRRIQEGVNKVYWRYRATLNIVKRLDWNYWNPTDFMFYFCFVLRICEAIEWVMAFVYQLSTPQDLSCGYFRNRSITL